MVLGYYLNFSDASSPAIPHLDLGISCIITSTACGGIPTSSKTLVMFLTICLMVVSSLPSHK